MKIPKKCNQRKSLCNIETYISKGVCSVINMNIFIKSVVFNSVNIKYACYDFLCNFCLKYFSC